MKDKLLNIFPAFSYRNYQLYFFAQLISLIGTWLQMIAEAWLALELTNSAFWVGIITATGFLPILLFSLFGGVIIDRFHTKNVLTFTNIAAMCLSIILGILAITGLLNVWVLMVMAFLLGCVNAIDMPARQSFTVDLVPREHLPSAIALNMGMFNSSRVIGPALAGILIAKFGNGGAFILNGLTFIAPILALTAMKIQSVLPTEHAHPIEAIKVGLKYTFTHKLIGNLILYAAVFSIFGFSFNTILPVIAKNTFNQDASGLGTMYTAAGLGALLGTGLVAVAAKRFKELTLIFWGSLSFVVSMLIFSITTNFAVALSVLFLQGVVMAFPFAMLFSSIQRHVDHAVRGRVMSIFTLAFLGMQPFGSLQIGFFAEHFGSSRAIQINSVIVLAMTFYIYFALREKSDNLSD